MSEETALQRHEAGGEHGGDAFFIGCYECELLRRVERAEKRELEWRRAFSECTPGGSEYQSPEACRAYVREFKIGQLRATTEAYRAKNEAERERDLLIKLARMAFPDEESLLLNSRALPLHEAVHAIESRRKARSFVAGLAPATGHETQHKTP